MGSEARADWLRTVVALGREQRGVEFKSPGALKDRRLRAKVIRAILGMANLPDGGSVVVGVSESGPGPSIAPCTERDAGTWSNDNLNDAVSQYADPYVDIDVTVVPWETGAVVIVSVRPFDDIPVICKKDSENVLRRGAMYVRHRGKVETLEVPSHVEMREVIERAARLQLAKLLQDHQIGVSGKARLADDGYAREREGLP